MKSEITLGLSEAQLQSLRKATLRMVHQMASQQAEVAEEVQSIIATARADRQRETDAQEALIRLANEPRPKRKGIPKAEANKRVEDILDRGCGLTIRQVAKAAECSTGQVSGTTAWKERQKPLPAPRAVASTETLENLIAEQRGDDEGSPFIGRRGPRIRKRV